MNGFRKTKDSIFPYTRLTSALRTHKVKRYKNILHTREMKKRAGLAILISDKVVFMPKIITKDK